MAEARHEADPPLKILHVLRAPLGGLFRHVVDLTREQVRRGHAVGIIADATTGGDAAVAQLDSLAPDLALGVTRIPIRRNPHPADLGALSHVSRRVRAARPDVIHGHGSKGGAYARLCSSPPGTAAAIRAYTPHGGSFNYRPGGFANRAYMGAERLLAARTDALLCESAYIARRFETLVGQPAGLARIVHNGISESEFAAVTPRKDAAVFLYVGELRAAKGIDVLLDALAELGRRRGVPARTVLVGSGPDEAALEERVRRLGLEGTVSFAGPLPARRAFELGRVLVVPSRIESLPYIALEAAAARMPMIATDVGGLPEVFGPLRERLVAPGDAGALARRMMEVLSEDPETTAATSASLERFVRDRFSMAAMADGVLAAYREALAAKRSGAATAAPMGVSSSAPIASGTS